MPTLDTLFANMHYVYVHIFVCMYVNMHIYMYVCMYIYTRVRIWMGPLLTHTLHCIHKFWYGGERFIRDGYDSSDTSSIDHLVMREFVSGPPRYHLAIKGVREQFVVLETLE